MKVRLWDRNKDYDTVVSWWRGHKCPEDYAVANECLPPSGWIVEDDEGVPLCITWLYYFAHAPGALLGSVVSNPEADAKVRLKAIDLLMLKVTTDADHHKAAAIVGVSTREGVVRRLKKHGFTQTTKHSVEFQRMLGAQ